LPATSIHTKAYVEHIGKTIDIHVRVSVKGLNNSFKNLGSTTGFNNYNSKHAVARLADTLSEATCSTPGE